MGAKVLVTGAGGFIGERLVSYLKSLGYWVRGADVKLPEFRQSIADEFLRRDLRRWENCLRATSGMEEVYALAADMGGAGYIFTGEHDAAVGPAFHMDGDAALAQRLDVSVDGAHRDTELAGQVARGQAAFTLQKLQARDQALRLHRGPFDGDMTRPVIYAAYAACMTTTLRTRRAP